MSSPHSFCLSIVQSGDTSLHLASDGGHLDVVKALIEARCNVNAVDEVSLFMLTHDLLMHMTYSYNRSVSVLSSCSLFVHCEGALQSITSGSLSWSPRRCAGAHTGSL